MKYLIPFLFFVTQASGAINLLVDHFEGESVDPTKWTVETPYADSSVVVENGYLQVQNRGRITSVQSFATPYEVFGTLQLSNNQYTNSKVVLRTDGSLFSVSEMPGIAVQFQIRNDDAVVNQLSISTIGATPEETVSVALTTALDLDTWYNFKIEDDGETVMLFWNGSESPVLTLDSSFSVGDQIGFYNREGSGGGSSISNDGIGRLDQITVTAIPEPALIAFSSGLFAVCVVFQMKKRRGKRTPAS